MICFDNVTKHYSSAQDPGSAALSNVSFFLQSGTFNFITGHSGAGKSTLLRLLAGLDRPSSGDIIVEDQALQTLNDAQLTGVRECMGIVFQDNQLLQDRSVFDNVALPLIISKRGKREIVDRVSAALERVALRIRQMPDHTRFPVANNNVSELHAPWSTDHGYLSLMSRQAIWIHK